MCGSLIDLGTEHVCYLLKIKPLCNPLNRAELHSPSLEGGKAWKTFSTMMLTSGKRRELICARNWGHRQRRGWLNDLTKITFINVRKRHSVAYSFKLKRNHPCLFQAVKSRYWAKEKHNKAQPVGFLSVSQQFHSPISHFAMFGDKWREYCTLQCRNSLLFQANE